MEQRNDAYKNLLQLPKTGVWVSHPTQGRDTPVQRLVVSESPVDAMSYHQLHHRGGAGQPNTLYVATSGTVTERQVELIQRLIDKQEPGQVVLANDNDAAGRRFNMNYLNELQAPRRAREITEGQVAYDEAPRPVEWHATAAGRYHTALRVEFHHGTRAEGTAQLAQLTAQVQQLGPAAEQGVVLEVQRASRQQTLVRLVAPNADSATLEALARTLHAQRETQRGQLDPQPHEPGRQPEHFIRIEYAISKDFNRDLELRSQGLSPEQVARQAQVDEQTRQRQRARPEPAVPSAAQASELAPAPSAVAPSAAGDPTLRRTLQLAVVEPAPAGETAPTQAQQMRELLGKAGAQVELTPAAQEPDRGQLRSELTVSYHPHATPGGLPRLSQALDALENSALVTLHEPAADQAERRRLAAGPAPAAATRTVLVRLDEPAPAPGMTGRAEAVAAQLGEAGLATGSLQSATDLATRQRHSELAVSYRLDQPDLARVSAALDELARQPGVQVHEPASERAERHQRAPAGVSAARQPTVEAER